MTYWKPAVVIVAILSLLVFTALTINPTPLSGDKHGKIKASDASGGGAKYVDLGEFLINLKGGYGGQYVKASIALKLDQSDAVTTVEARIPEIRHHVNMVFQSRTADELSTHEGKLRLAGAIREHAEYVMGLRKTAPVEGIASLPITNSAISDVLFTAFIMH